MRLVHDRNRASHHVDRKILFPSYLSAATTRGSTTEGRKIPEKSSFRWNITACLPRMPNIVTIMIRHEERKREKERELRLARERERGEEYGRKEGRKMARRKGVLRVCKMRVERNGWVSGGTRACMQKFWFSAGLLASSFFFFFFLTAS